MLVSTASSSSPDTNVQGFLKKRKQKRQGEEGTREQDLSPEPGRVRSLKRTRKLVARGPCKMGVKVELKIRAG